MHLLLRSNWPGNTEQLRQVLRQVARHRRTGTIHPGDLPPECWSVSRRLLSPLESIERDAIVQSLLGLPRQQGQDSRITRGVPCHDLPQDPPVRDHHPGQLTGVRRPYRHPMENTGVPQGAPVPPAALPSTAKGALFHRPRLSRHPCSAKRGYAPILQVARPSRARPVVAWMCCCVPMPGHATLVWLRGGRQIFPSGRWLAGSTDRAARGRLSTGMRRRSQSLRKHPAGLMPVARAHRLILAML